jgi:hypothetical protein
MYDRSHTFLHFKNSLKIITNPQTQILFPQNQHHPPPKPPYFPHKNHTPLKFNTLNTIKTSQKKFL